MIVREFPLNFQKYRDFAVWEVENLDAFFAGNQVLATVLEGEYKIPLAELPHRRSEIEGSDMSIMNNLLDLVGDKHFYLFTLHDENHLELVKMQMMKAMNFGMDIEELKPDCVYIMMMDQIPGMESNQVLN